jgi:hypothetical protein
MGKWKTKSRFPTFPQPLATITPVLSLKTKNQERKSAATRPPHSPIRSPYGRTEPISCSFFDWKMLFYAYESTRHLGALHARVVTTGPVTTAFCVCAKAIAAPARGHGGSGHCSAAPHGPILSQGRRPYFLSSARQYARKCFLAECQSGRLAFRFIMPFTISGLNSPHSFTLR